MKIFLCIVVISANFRLYCSQAAKKYDCSHPHLSYSVGMHPFKGIAGFTQKDVHVLYDGRYNRTVFLSALLDVKYTHMTKAGSCTVKRAEVGVYPPDVAGRLLVQQLGGSCDRMNLFPQNKICSMGLWKMYQKKVALELKKHGKVRYCVKLVYSKANGKRPTKIISRTFSYPHNKYLRSIAISNPSNGDCFQLPHLI